MATKRFYWMPWKLRGDLADALGTTTKWNAIFGAAQNSHPMGFRQGYQSLVYADELAFTDGNAVMQHYAVTTDPARVPGTAKALNAQITVPSEWPYTDSRQRYTPTHPTYTYWTGVDNPACSHWDDAPDNVRDWRGPVRAFFLAKPWAFFAYEMTGVTQLSGSEVVCAGYQQYLHVFPNWWKLGWNTGTTVATWHNYMSGNYQIFPMAYAGMCPVVIYVFRPSTRAIVGALAWDTFANMKAMLTANSNQVTLPSAVTGFQREQWTYNWGSFQTVSGIQNGDLLVWEWWVFAIPPISMANPAVNLSYNLTPTAVIANYVGGGVAGQPLTFDGNGYPNWAPAHRSEITTAFGGVEPNPPRRVDLSVGF